MFTRRNHIDVVDVKVKLSHVNYTLSFYKDKPMQFCCSQLDIFGDAYHIFFFLYKYSSNWRFQGKTGSGILLDTGSQRSRLEGRSESSSTR